MKPLFSRGVSLPVPAGALCATLVALSLVAASVHADPSPPAAQDAEGGDALYSLGPDSMRHDGVPRGEVTRHVWESDVFEGTHREYWIYVPAQYDPESPACLMVFQDGHTYVDEEGSFRVPIVFDNLIHRGEMPVTIGLFVNPGHRSGDFPENRWRVSNRSLEYDTLSDRYARLLLEELLPELSKSYNLRTDPDSRAICGISSGGICAFTVAWERPDAFRKVLSHVGSFTNIRGGHHYAAIIRKTPRKPLRVFLQAGKRDLNNRHGNWYLANLQMRSSLEFAGYDLRFVEGEGEHSGVHGGAILPESLRWLWRDHPGVKPSTQQDESTRQETSTAAEEERP